MAMVHVGAGPTSIPVFIPFHYRQIIPMTCPDCRMDIYPIVKHVPSTKTHRACLIMSLLGCCICAPCVYLDKNCLSQECYCPLCNRHLRTLD